MSNQESRVLSTHAGCGGIEVIVPSGSVYGGTVSFCIKCQDERIKSLESALATANQTIAAKSALLEAAVRNASEMAKKLAEAKAAHDRTIEGSDWIACVARLDNQLAEARAILRELVEALPQCSYCGTPATRAYERGHGRYCDAHRFQDAIREARREAPEYPRAGPLRRAAKWLAR